MTESLVEKSPISTPGGGSEVPGEHRGGLLDWPESHQGPIEALGGFQA
jgi:hypothetical protein